ERLFSPIHTLREPQHEVASLHMLRDVDEFFDESCHWLLATRHRQPMVQHISCKARRVRRLKSLHWKVVWFDVVSYLTLDQSGHISTLKDIPLLKTFYIDCQINIAVCVWSSVNVRPEDIASAHLHMPSQNPESLDRPLLYYRTAESHRKTSSVATYVC